MANRYNILPLLLLGFTFHVVYMKSVFDCYFTSPVINGMQSHSVGYGPAKRLVLFVGDGLRADLFYNQNPFPSIKGSPEYAAPYLRNIAKERGAFGVSHTRVPTESRPGHVAIIGGMYEDVSAVTKGWKTNPVDFDSVFNRSSSTFSFGSPDILPMFARGASPGKVKTWSYDEHQEDFTKESTLLDMWVLDQLKTLLYNATINPLLEAELKASKVVFFLHLLGLDMAGHSYRPHSPEYMKNIQLVDDIVRQTEELMTQFYGDSETSYIFTADHGMSVIGNHGDGHPDNTRTPLVAWGMGVRGPLPDSQPSSHDIYSKPWNLSHLIRRDVEQADIAALMSALLGIDWPVNSVGVLPDVDTSRSGYLATNQISAEAALVNAKVILEQYTSKHELKQLKTLFYEPFTPLETPVKGNPFRLTEVNNIQQLIDERKWEAARLASAELIQTTLRALHYLQTYDRFLIQTIVIAAYLGWAVYCSLYIFQPLNAVSELRSPIWVTLLFGSILISTWIAFALQGSPWTFYLYTIFPFYFWHQTLSEILQRSWHWVSIPSLKNLTRAALVLVTLQAMVVGYTHRSVWSIGFVVLGLIWPLTWSIEEREAVGPPATLWTLLCLVSTLFPLFPIDKKEKLSIIMASGFIILIVGKQYSKHIVSDKENGAKLGRLYMIQGVLIIFIMLVTAGSVRSLQAKQGLPVLNQIAGWFLLCTSSVLPFANSSRHTSVDSKLLMYFLGFGPLFIILSISIEGLYYAVYFVTLLLWIEVEAGLREYKIAQRTKSSGAHDDNGIEPDNLRIALMFLFFVQVGFFGTGNVASVSSFYLEPVYRLLPIFNPSFMAALLVFKIIAPYIILSVTFTALNYRLELPPFSLFLIAMALTDGMTLTFFFQVTDTGSWLEIGQSISFFCITSLLLLWSAGIYAVGEYLMADVTQSRESGELSKRKE